MSSSTPPQTVGELSLSTLLTSLSTTLSEETYTFSTIPQHHNIFSLFAGLPVQMLFREAEGWTVILPQEAATSIGLEGTFPCKKITLNVHSSLEAVGFMAVITRRLTELNVGVNPVSGFYHDHLFVPVGKEGDVIRALEEMAEEARNGSGSSD